MNEAEHLDRLAVERTRLANERTLLAYVRTALALGAAGAAMTQVFPGQTPLVVVALLLMAAGAATGVIGVRRFLIARRAINAGAAK